MQVTIKKKVLFNFLKNALNENPSRSDNITNLGSNALGYEQSFDQIDEPIEPVSHMSVQLSTEEPPVSDSDWEPGSKSDLKSAASAIINEVPQDKISFFYKMLHKALDMALDDADENLFKLAENKKVRKVLITHAVKSAVLGDFTIDMLSENLSLLNAFKGATSNQIKECLSRNMVKTIGILNQINEGILDNQPANVVRIVRSIAVKAKRDPEYLSRESERFRLDGMARRAGISTDKLIMLVNEYIKDETFNQVPPVQQQPSAPPVSSRNISASEAEMLSKDEPSFEDLEREENLANALKNQAIQQRNLTGADVELKALLEFIDIIAERFDQIMFDMSQAKLTLDQGGLTPDYAEAKGKYLPLKQIKSGPLSKSDSKAMLNYIKQKYGLTSENMPDINTVTEMDENVLYDLVLKATQGILDNKDNNPKDAVVKSKFDSEYTSYTIDTADPSKSQNRNDVIGFIANLMTNKLIQQGQEGQAKQALGENDAIIRTAIAKSVYSEKTGKLRKPPYRITNETILMKRLSAQNSLYVDETNPAEQTEMMQKIIELVLKDRQVKKQLSKKMPENQIESEIIKYLENLQIAAREKFPESIVQDVDADETILDPELEKQKKEKRKVEDDKRFYTWLAEFMGFKGANGARQWYLKHLQSKLQYIALAQKSQGEDVDFGSGMQSLRKTYRKTHKDLVNSFWSAYQEYLGNWDRLNKGRARTEQTKLEDAAMIRLRDDLDDLKDYVNSRNYLNFKDTDESEDSENPLNSVLYTFVGQEIREKNGDVFKRATNYIMDTAAPNIVSDIFADMFPDKSAQEIQKMTKELQEHISGKSNRPFRQGSTKASQKFEKYGIDSKKFEEISLTFIKDLDEVLESAFTSREAVEKLKGKERAMSIEDPKARKASLKNVKARVDKMYATDKDLSAITKKLKSGLKMKPDDVNNVIDSIAAEYMAAFKMKYAGEEKIGSIEQRLASGEDISDEDLEKALESEKANNVKTLAEVIKYLSLSA